MSHHFPFTFGFGWEAGRIAQSLALGHGYADPFVFGRTGPTAWLPPLFPLIIAASFKLFGIYTPFANGLVIAIDSLFSALTAPATYEIASRCFNRRVALWSGWLWALHPVAMQYAVKWVWETCLTTMLFCFVLVLALRVRGIGDTAGEAPQPLIRNWLLFGFLWGLIALSNPSLLLFLPICGGWMLIGTKTPRKALLAAMLSGLIFLGCVAPWMLRNQRVFHAFIPMRGNFGAELWYGNSPYSLGFPFGIIVAAQPDLRHYRDVGEYRYVSELGERAKGYIREDPAHFALLTLKRFYFFWVSIPHPLEKRQFSEYFREFHYCSLSITGILGLLLALRRRVAASGLFAWAFLLLPMTYYFVTVAARFRHPLEPLIAILTVYLIYSADRHKLFGIFR